MKTKSWNKIKDEVYGKRGSSRRDTLDKEVASIKLGIILKEAREKRELIQQELADLIDKKRTFISRIENDGSNMTLKTLFQIVEIGLGGKLKISIEV